LAQETHNLPSIRRCEGRAVGRGCPRRQRPAGARRGGDVEVARLAGALALAQHGRGPVLLIAEDEPAGRPAGAAVGEACPVGQLHGHGIQARSAPEGQRRHFGGGARRQRRHVAEPDPVRAAPEAWLAQGRPAAPREIHVDGIVVA